MAWSEEAKKRWNAEVALEAAGYEFGEAAILADPRTGKATRQEVVRAREAREKAALERRVKAQSPPFDPDAVARRALNPFD
ncbi:hypothetical protein [Kitasatospora sp. NPDC101183]|uniref:hypothetical protein n=1 Tax=Kitasatospora sp. NPDC101183 TaxID=3364100 RepID=UPI0037F9D50E